MTTTHAPVTVEQCDRNAAMRLLEMGDQDWQAKEVRIGDGDHFPIVQAFARHRLAALASAPACAASPDHADIMETIANAADNWQKQGYLTALAEVRDMANVGRSLLERIADHCSEGPLKSWHPADCPTEIVCHLLNMLADATTPAERDDHHQYSIGPLTMDHVFKAASLTNMSDMQAVLDAIEVALAAQIQPAKAAS